MGLVTMNLRKWKVNYIIILDFNFICMLYLTSSSSFSMCVWSVHSRVWYVYTQVRCKYYCSMQEWSAYQWIEPLYQWKCFPYLQVRYVYLQAWSVYLWVQSVNWRVQYVTGYQWEHSLCLRVWCVVVPADTSVYQCVWSRIRYTWEYSWSAGT